MQQMARTERAALCNTALEVGPDAPTLCGEWTVKQLICHLLVRERHPVGASGIVVPPLSGLTDRAMESLEDQDFASLVERVRGGPPRWAPFALPKVDAVVNTLEYLVHHEDIRRAQEGWTARELSDREQQVVWRLIRVAGKGLVRPADVPVAIRTPEGRAATLRKGADPAVVTGPPVELALMLYGRDQVAGLEFSGPGEKIATLRQARLGL